MAGQRKWFDTVNKELYALPMWILLVFANGHYLSGIVLLSVVEKQYKL